MKFFGHGKIGEDAACSYLKKQHYKILKRNYKKRYGEIDIIAQKGDCIVFVEVKTRSGIAYGTPAEYVTAKKQHKIILCAEEYLQQKKLDVPVSFDVVEVFLQGGKVANLHHIENAFST